MEKEKRKYSPYIHRRLYVLLIGWMLFTFLAALNPFIWLAPPHMQLTPYLYVFASLSWIPFLWWHIRRWGSNWFIIFLIVGCLITGGFLSKTIINKAEQYIGVGGCQRFSGETTGWSCSSEARLNNGCYEIEKFDSVAGFIIIKRMGESQGAYLC